MSTNTQEYSVNLNCRHLWNYLPARRLYHVITHYPQETVSYMDKARDGLRVEGCARGSVMDKGCVCGWVYLCPCLGLCPCALPPGDGVVHGQGLCIQTSDMWMGINA